MPRLGHDSVRYRLIHEGRVPVWTHGPGAQPRKLVRPTRSVACIVDPERPGRAHLRSAAHFAARLGATLHVIESISDLFDEGKLLLLAYSAIDREQIADQIRREVADTALVPEVHLVTAGRVCDALVRLDADVVFLDGPRWTSRRWWRRRVSTVVDALPCPAICLDADRDSQPWPLRRPVRLSELEEMQLPGVARVNAFADESEEMAFAMVRQTRDAEPGR
jgi:hypothetical protein